MIFTRMVLLSKPSLISNSSFTVSFSTGFAVVLSVPVDLPVIDGAGVDAVVVVDEEAVATLSP